jgi:hypothetical protein
MALGFSSTFNAQFWGIYLMLPLSFSIIRTFLLFVLFRHDSPFYNAEMGRSILFFLYKSLVNEAYQFVDYVYKPEFRDEFKCVLKESSLVRKSELESNRSFLKPEARSRVKLGVLCNIFYALSGITPMISFSTTIFH